MIIGLDASTSTVGICILDENGEIVQNYFLKLKSQKEFCTKGDVFKDELEKIVKLPDKKKQSRKTQDVTLTTK